MLSPMLSVSPALVSTSARCASEHSCKHIGFTVAVVFPAVFVSSFV